MNNYSEFNSEFRRQELKGKTNLIGILWAVFLGVVAIVGAIGFFGGLLLIAHRV